MRVVGVDPGTVITGYGIVERAPQNFRFLASGVIRTRAGEAIAARLSTIYRGLLAVIDDYRPAAMSLERNFVGRNIQSAFRIGEARAAAMLAAAERGLPLYEYPPNQVKLAVAAFGHADKAQVKFMVRRTLNLAADYELADDAADALAIALCHLGRAKAARMIDAIERPGLTAASHAIRSGRR